jgi:uridine phosphorylase
MSAADPPKPPPILSHKHHGAPSTFVPGNLLREARRQKGLADGAVPEICVLDPDGDIVRRLVADGRAAPDPVWACYHSAMHRFTHGAETFGIVGCAVGAAYAVLVAEQMFASGCRLLISVTSAGEIDPLREPPYFVLIERALRDEGTSYHYLPPSPFSEIDAGLVAALAGAFDGITPPVERAATWTTDAPFRETEEAIAAARAHGVAAVEMEAAALYAFAHARARPVICLAHVTNRMAQDEGDFEKGEAGGALDALDVIAAAARGWRNHAATG